jgi:hypothetical protein
MPALLATILVVSSQDPQNPVGTSKLGLGNSPVIAMALPRNFVGLKMKYICCKKLVVGLKK